MSPFKNFQVEEAEKVITPKNAVGIMQMLGENLFFDTLLALALMVCGIFLCITTHDNLDNSSS